MTTEPHHCWPACPFALPTEHARGCALDIWPACPSPWNCQSCHYRTLPPTAVRECLNRRRLYLIHHQADPAPIDRLLAALTPVTAAGPSPSRVPRECPAAASSPSPLPPSAIPHSPQEPTP
jgi:hypothetical protein